MFIDRIPNNNKKKLSRFWTVNFRVIFFFPENWVFSIFAKKSNNKFVLVEKNGIVWMKKMSWILWCQVRGNRKKITAEKICIKEMEKKSLLKEFWADF